MAPNREACELLSQVYKTKSEIIGIIRSIRRARSAAQAIVAAVRFGLSIASSVLADAVATAAGIAASGITAILGPISQIAASISNAILKKLLAIFLSGPQAIMSLVTIPYEAAMKAIGEEQAALGRCNASINLVYSIVMKWRVGGRGAEFYSKMISAIPHIEKALTAISELIDGLEVDDDDIQSNAFFNTHKYNTVLYNLKVATDKSMPEGSVVDNSRYERFVAAASDKIYRETSAAEIANHNSRMSDINARYYAEMASVGSTNTGVSTNDIANAARIEIIVSKYDIQKKAQIEFHKSKLRAMKIEAEVKARTSPDVYTAIGASVAAEFMCDLNIITKNIREFYRNIAIAFAANKRSQLMLNTIVNIEPMVSLLIGEIIDILRGSGNKAASSIVPVLKGAEASMSLCKSTYRDAIVEYVGGSTNEVKMALSLSKGWLYLEFANKSLAATVTDSLIKIINSDESMLSTSSELKRLIARISAIPDWDGKPLVWAVDPLQSSRSPYIDLVLKSSSMILDIPNMLFGGGGDIQSSVRENVLDLRKSFAVVKKHASAVYVAISSYQPYYGSEYGDIAKILKSAGVFDKFASTMSFISVIREIAQITGSLDDTEYDVPNYNNCRASYPSMFRDQSTVSGAVDERNNVQPADTATGNGAREGAEGSAPDIHYTKEGLGNFDPYAEVLGEGRFS